MAGASMMQAKDEAAQSRAHEVGLASAQRAQEADAGAQDRAHEVALAQTAPSPPGPGEAPEGE